MTDDDDLSYWLRRLDSTDAGQRVTSLRSIAGRPLPDARLLAACERLLTDRTMALLSLPYTFGEVRWCAADAVIAVREVLAIPRPVVLFEVFAPRSATEIGDLARSAGIPFDPRGGIEGVLGTLETLATMELLPRRTVTRTPDVTGSTE